MSNNNLLLAVVGTVMAAAGVMAYDSLNNRIDKMDNTLDGITRAVGSISDNVDLTVPDNIVQAAIGVATEKAVNSAVKSASESIKANVTKEISKRVTATCEDAYKNVEETVKNKLLEQINNGTSITKIETAVTDTVAKEVLKRFISNNSNQNRGYNQTTSNKAEVAKTMIENGYDYWEIGQVLKGVD